LCGSILFLLVRYVEPRRATMEAATNGTSSESGLRATDPASVVALLDAPEKVYRAWSGALPPSAGWMRLNQRKSEEKVSRSKLILELKCWCCASLFWPAGLNYLLSCSDYDKVQLIRPEGGPSGGNQTCCLLDVGNNAVRVGRAAGARHDNNGKIGLVTVRVLDLVVVIVIQGDGVRAAPWVVVGFPIGS